MKEDITLDQLKQGDHKVFSRLFILYYRDLVLFAGRYVHDVAGEWRTLLAAARLRGFRARTSLHSYRTLASLLGILLLRGLDRAQRVHEAMRLRGFRQRFHCVTPFQAHLRDAVFVAVMGAAMGVLCWLEFR